MANTSILAAFERMWQHINLKLNNKCEKDFSNVNNVDFKNKASESGLITYSTKDLTAGTSELATGALYFVYE